VTYEEQRAVILADLKGKLFREDWHGVMDCAADLRELDAYHRGLIETPSCGG
jgi:hypothetical protein